MSNFLKRQLFIFYVLGLGRRIEGRSRLGTLYLRFEMIAPEFRRSKATEGSLALGVAAIGALLGIIPLVHHELAFELVTTLLARKLV